MSIALYNAHLCWWYISGKSIFWKLIPMKMIIRPQRTTLWFCIVCLLTVRVKIKIIADANQYCVSKRTEYKAREERANTCYKKFHPWKNRVRKISFSCNETFCSRYLLFLLNNFSRHSKAKTWGMIAYCKFGKDCVRLILRVFTFSLGRKIKIRNH